MAKDIMERAARAVAIASDSETAARASIGQEPFIQDSHRKIARAVLEAIREPTDVMDDAGMVAADKQVPGVAVGPIWRAMIEAALDEDEDSEDWRSEAIHLGI